MTELTFMLCTFHRELLLADALASILRLEGLDQVDCEIVVVDNSDEGSAAATVAAIAAGAALPVRYIAAHPPNIAAARNAGVAAAAGAWIAMIDDDMTVQPAWLTAIRPLIAAGTFDILCGPVEPVFEDPALVSREALAFFHRTLDLPAGSPLRVLGPTRTRQFIPATSNSVFRRATCFTDDIPFNLRYGRTGGEDVDLFCRLERRGRRIAWVPGAVSSESVPAHRCSLDYLERRSLSGGQIFAATYVRNSQYPAWTAVKVAAIARLQWLAGLVRARLTPARDAGEERARTLRRAAIQGKLSWRQMFPIYAAEHDSVKAGRRTA